MNIWSILLFTLLSASWLAVAGRMGRFELNMPYHVALDRRDRRRSKFYQQSIWSGLGISFLSLMSIDAIATAEFDSRSERIIALGIAKILALWGLMVVAVVWAQVGAHASQAAVSQQSPVQLPK